MHIGMFAINSGACADPGTMVDVAQRAEALDYESVWAGEHVVLPSPRVPPSPLRPETKLVDPLIALSAVASATSRVRLGTGILILPLRNPLVLAKQIASLDTVSHGRFLFGIGVGALQQEFNAVGVPFEDRGRRADDYLEAIRVMWSATDPTHHGPYVDFSGVDAHPRPVQDRVPVIVGGHTEAALRRAVEKGDGWYGFGIDVEATEHYLGLLAEVQGRYERPPGVGPLEITVTPPLRSSERDGYEALGVDRLVYVPSHSLDREGLLEWLEERAPRSS
jgi:probable F420-dependent oxidoreductase